MTTAVHNIVPWPRPLDFHAFCNARSDLSVRHVAQGDMSRRETDAVAVVPGGSDTYASRA